MLVLLVGRATNPDFVISKRHFKLAVIAEMIHTASLIHGDVLEENADPSEEEKGTVVHQEARQLPLPSNPPSPSPSPSSSP